jgi:8-oxo-dGTP diphosphatase
VHTVRAVRTLVAAIVPGDATEAAHQRDALAWLDSSPDIYRRAKPATPSRHLVSYAVLIDPRDLSVFLVDHLLAGLCLPPGGHVEPGEDPAVTARREAKEELGIEADFSLAGEQPVFLTVTRTVPSATDAGHTDVSLWYLLAGNPELTITLDPREFSGGRWWSAAQIEAAGPGRFDPHLGRFLAKVSSLGSLGAFGSPDPGRPPEVTDGR